MTETLVARERPADGRAEGALVLFHGRGTDEHDLFPLLDALDPERRLHGYTPRGPLALPPGGAHWYVVQRVGHPDPRTFHGSYAAATAWLDALPFDRVVLGGFSQGAVMSLALGLGGGLRTRPAAIVAFSGFVPVVEGWELDPAPPLPAVTLCHGSLDPVVDVSFGRSAKELLKAAGADVVYHESPIGHTIDPASVVLARGRIAETLA
jgi:phospholipase/carboxylesterase